MGIRAKTRISKDAKIFRTGRMGYQLQNCSSALKLTLVSPLGNAFNPREEFRKSAQLKGVDMRLPSAGELAVDPAAA
jgi:hypothetical protein